MKKIILFLLLIFFINNYLVFAKEKYSYQDYYSYALNFFHQNNYSWQSGEDTESAVKIAAELYRQQMDLDLLRSELQANNPSFQVANKFKNIRALREWFLLIKNRGMGAQS